MGACIQVGTPLFAAPEIMAHEPYDGSADVWSYGCLLSCIANAADEPYPKEELQTRHFNGIMRAVIDGSLVPEHASPSPLGDIGRDCNALDPSRRPNFTKLVELMQDAKLNKWAEAEDAALAKEELRRFGL